MKILASLAVICLVPATAVYCAAPEIKTFPAAGIQSLRVETGAGDILVEGAPGDIRVEVTGEEPGKCLLTMKAEAGIFLVRAEDDPAAATKRGFWRSLFGGFHGENGCQAGFKVSAPAALPLSAANGSGEIYISGRDGDVSAGNGSGHIKAEKITGNLDVKNGSGGLSGAGCPKSLRARTGSGGITFTGLCGPVNAAAGSGNIELKWTGVPPAGEVSARTGSGDITMVFPPSAAIAAKLDNGSGSIRNDFVNGGKFPVSAGAGSGNISLLKAVK
ncbi:MAG TPA: DUF4097 family beta strand repeat-containing protein [Elusimicrobiales bacterium]|nr:DUF4097 family beta strand repeat-containing protein [Elusimicrobiales bacterium]